MRFLKSLFGGGSKDVPPAPFTALPEPDQPLVIIGDVHGMVDLLILLLEKLKSNVPENTQLILVGDLVDRGEDSAAVLNLVQELCADGAMCLRGNHEQMMLDFISHPEKNGHRWLRNGGLQTLMSFGIGRVTGSSGEEELRQCRDDLLQALPKGQIDWLKALPLQYASGNVHVVHAAADPELPMQMQPESTLLWGNGAFGKTTRNDDQLVVHGHTIVDFPTHKNGVISTDTGAFATGKLTAAIVSSGKVEFLQA